MAVFLLGGLLLISLGILGLKDPEKLRNRKTGAVPGKGKLIFAIIAGVFVFIVGTAGANSQSHDKVTPSSSPMSSSKQSPSPSTAKITQQMKSDYIAFYKQYMSIGNKSDATDKKVTDDLQTAANGSGNISVADIYIEAKDAHDSQEGLKMEEVGLQIPESLSDYKPDLQKADDSLFALLDSRSSAMNNLADALNTNDLEKVRQFRNSEQDQQSEMLGAVANLIKVAADLGVDTTKIQVN